VDGSDCPVTLVCQQYWQAIGSFDADKKTGRVGEQRIALGQASVAIRIDGDGGMDLAQGGQGFRRIKGSGTETVLQPVEPG
jgi:hypothetical protein